MKVMLLSLFLYVGFAQFAFSETIYFVCKTQSAAEIVAQNGFDLIPNLSALPAGCRWINGMPEGAAAIIKILQYVEVNDHIVWIAKVLRNNEEYGYSAGFIELTS